MISNIIDSLRYPSYNCARVNTGTYIIGDGMGVGTPVNCQWRTIKGKIIEKRLRPINVRDGNHDRTISRLNVFVLYPRTDTAIIEISNRHGKHRIRLVKHRKGTRSTILKERL
jgi:hypothetical protein